MFTIWLLHFQLFIRIPGKKKHKVEKGKIKGYASFCIFFFFSEAEALSQGLPNGLLLTFHYAKLFHGPSIWKWLRRRKWESELSLNSAWHTAFHSHHPTTWSALSVISHVTFTHVLCRSCPFSPVLTAELPFVFLYGLSLFNLHNKRQNNCVTVSQSGGRRLYALGLFQLQVSKNNFN